MDWIMGKKYIKIKLAIIAFILLLLGVFLYQLLQPKPWPELPKYPNSTQITVQKSENGRVRIISFYSTDLARRIIIEYGAILRDFGWRGLILNPVKPDFRFIDTSRDIDIFGVRLYSNECPAFYLNVDLEDIGNEQTRVTVTQTVGPCGWSDPS